MSTTAAPKPANHPIYSLPRPWQVPYTMAERILASLPGWIFFVGQGKPWPIVLHDPSLQRVLVVGASFVDDQVVEGRQVLGFERKPFRMDRKSMPVSFHAAKDRRDWVMKDATSEFRGTHWQTRMICRVVHMAGYSN